MVVVFCQRRTAKEAKIRINVVGKLLIMSELPTLFNRMTRKSTAERRNSFKNNRQAPNKQGSQSTGSTDIHYPYRCWNTKRDYKPSVIAQGWHYSIGMLRLCGRLYCIMSDIFILSIQLYLLGSTITLHYAMFLLFFRCIYIFLYHSHCS